MEKDIVNRNGKGEYHGVQIRYYDDNPGQIGYKHNYINGHQHGEQIGYYSNGQLWYKVYYINGDEVSHSEWIDYNRKLKIKMISNL
jgi:antitoxin component YwqK of YwqJK toxin-antitoxin module